MSVGQMVLTKSHGAKKQQKNQIYLKVFEKIILFIFVLMFVKLMQLQSQL